jgi:hypothetical protein
MLVQTLYRATVKGEMLPAPVDIASRPGTSVNSYRLIDSLWNFEVLRDSRPGLEFVTHERPLCFWRPVMLYSEVGMSVTLLVSMLLGLPG